MKMSLRNFWLFKCVCHKSKQVSNCLWYLDDSCKYCFVTSGSSVVPWPLEHFFQILNEFVRLMQIFINFVSSKFSTLWDLMRRKNSPRRVKSAEIPDKQIEGKTALKFQLLIPHGFAILVSFFLASVRVQQNDSWALMEHSNRDLKHC